VPPWPRPLPRPRRPRLALMPGSASQTRVDQKQPQMTPTKPCITFDGLREMKRERERERDLLDLVRACGWLAALGCGMRS
jgi:hypothetical protein